MTRVKKTTNQTGRKRKTAKKRKGLPADVKAIIEGLPPKAKARILVGYKAEKAKIPAGVEGVPRRCWSMYAKAFKTRSRRYAIRAHCLECMAWSPSEVDLCTSYACPLYRFRHGTSLERLHVDGDVVMTRSRHQKMEMERKRLERERLRAERRAEREARKAEREAAKKRKARRAKKPEEVKSDEPEPKPKRRRRRRRDEGASR